MVDFEYVLELVNQAREAVNYPPIEALSPGPKADADKCPIALALPGNPVVAPKEAIWETTPHDKTPEVVAEVWGVGFKWLEVNKAALLGAGSTDYSCLVPLPGELVDFLKQFDNGMYPELEA